VAQRHRDHIDDIGLVVGYENANLLVLLGHTQIIDFFAEKFLRAV
jgi:hypothetical protein